MAGLHDGGRQFRNKILSRLSRGDADILLTRLELVPLKFRQRLETAGRKITEVVFIEEGLVSVIGLSSRRREQAEVALLGREGFTGCATLLGIDRSPHDALVQVAGSGLRIGIEEFHRAVAGSTTLREHLTRFAHVSGV